MSECYISVDIEADGPVPAGGYSMLEIGAVVVLNPEETFSVILPMRRGSHSRADQCALRAIGLDNETYIERHFMNVPFENYPCSSIPRFAEWVKKVSGSHTPVFVANNAPFDWMFVCHYFDEHHIENPFGHTALDMKAYFMGLTGCSWNKATLSEMARYAGLQFNGLPHRALDDAIIQGKIFRGLLNKEKMI